MTPKTKTFASPEAAIANAKKLFAKGDISKEEFTKTIQHLQKAELSQWLNKAYPGRS